MVTGLAACDAGMGRIHDAGSLATPARPLDAITACIDKVGIELDAAALFRHGATRVMKTLLKMDVARGTRVAPRGFWRPPIRKPRSSVVGRHAGRTDACEWGARRYRQKHLKLGSV